MDNDIDRITDEDRAQSFRDSHPQCAECGERCCPFNADGTLPAEHFACDADGAALLPSGECLHEGCKPRYTQVLIRDAIKDGLLVRRGAEINELTASERANNICIQVYEVLRELGIVEKKGK